jgi:hypothetical protein
LGVERKKDIKDIKDEKDERKQDVKTRSLSF